MSVRPSLHSRIVSPLTSVEVWPTCTAIGVLRLRPPKIELPRANIGHEGVSQAHHLFGGDTDGCRQHHRRDFHAEISGGFLDAASGSASTSGGGPTGRPDPGPEGSAFRRSGGCARARSRAAPGQQPTGARSRRSTAGRRRAAEESVRWWRQRPLLRTAASRLRARPARGRRNRHSANSRTMGRRG